MSKADLTKDMKSLYEINFEVPGHEPYYPGIEDRAQALSKLEYSVDTNDLRNFFKSKGFRGAFHLSFVAPYIKEMADLLAEYHSDSNLELRFYAGEGLLRSPSHRELGLKILHELVDSFFDGDPYQLDLALYWDLVAEREADHIEGFAELKEKIQRTKR